MLGKYHKREDFRIEVRLPSGKTGQACERRAWPGRSEADLAPHSSVAADKDVGKDDHWSANHVF